MAIKINNVPVIDDSRNLTNINGGAILGIQSTGNIVGSGATTINFVGKGNNFSYNESTKVLNVSIDSSSGASAFANSLIFGR